jgi:hypothetical protein
VIIHAAENFNCQAREKAKRDLLKRIRSGMVNDPGEVVGAGNLYWTLPMESARSERISSSSTARTS